MLNELPNTPFQWFLSNGLYLLFFNLVLLENIQLYFGPYLLWIYLII